MDWVKKYFGPIPSATLPPKPDISEAKQDKEKRATKADPIATRPALAVGYHAPPRNTPEYFAMGIIDQILVQGKDSRLYQALVQKNQLTGDVNGGINSGLGDMYNINGPTLWDVSLFYDKDKTSDQILAVMDVEIEKVRTTPVDQATLDRALVKMRSDFYDKIEQTGGFGRADLLASFALFDDDPARINTARGAVPPGHAGDAAEDGAGVPAAREPDDPAHRSQGRGQGAQERLVGKRTRP